MKVGNSDVTVIIPTLNEEKNIAGVIQELNRMGYLDILVVDANSRDRTVEIAKELGAKVILQKGRGKGSALRQAFNHDGVNGNAIVFMDGDGSTSPREIHRFIEALNSGADLVKGSRFLPSGDSEDMNLFRRIGNLFFVFMVNLLWSANYTDICYGFGAFKKHALETLYPYLRSTRFEIEAEICIKAKKLGLKVMEVPSMELRRNHGRSNLFAFRDGFLILRKVMTELAKRH